MSIIEVKIKNIVHRIGYKYFKRKQVMHYWIILNGHRKIKARYNLRVTKTFRMKIWKGKTKTSTITKSQTLQNKTICFNSLKQGHEAAWGENSIVFKIIRIFNNIFISILFFIGI